MTCSPCSRPAAQAETCPHLQITFSSYLWYIHSTPDLVSTLHRYMPKSQIIDNGTKEEETRTHRITVPSVRFTSWVNNRRCKSCHLCMDSDNRKTDMKESSFCSWKNILKLFFLFNICCTDVLTCAFIAVSTREIFLCFIVFKNTHRAHKAMFKYQHVWQKSPYPFSKYVVCLVVCTVYVTSRLCVHEWTYLVEHIFMWGTMCTSLCVTAQKEFRRKSQGQIFHPCASNHKCSNPPPSNKRTHSTG